MAQVGLGAFSDFRRVEAIKTNKETIRSLKLVTFVNGVIDAASLHRHALLGVRAGDSRMPGAAGGADDWIEPYSSRRRR